MERKSLRREDIVAAALALLDETGMDGLTMRAVANRLSVKAPALYWHFASKQDLVDEMGTQLWRGVLAEHAGADVASSLDRDAADRTDRQDPADGKEPAGWQEDMVGLALSMRRVLLRHRDGAKLFGGSYVTDPSLLQAQERPLTALTRAGMTLETAVEVWRVLYCYAIGALIEEQAVAQADDRYTPQRRRQRLDPTRFPLTSEASRSVFTDPGSSFERSVRRLVAAFENWGHGSAS